MADRPPPDDPAVEPPVGRSGEPAEEQPGDPAVLALTATAGWLIVAASHRPVILTLLAVIVAVRTFGIARPVLRYLERVRSHDGALDLLARRRVTTYRALVPLTPARLGRRARSDVLTAAVADLEDLVYAQVRVVVPVLGAAVAGALAVLVLALVVPLGALVLAAVLVAHAAVAALGRRLETDTQRVWLAARARVAGATTLATGYAGQLAAIGAGPTVVGWVEQVEQAAAAPSGPGPGAHRVRQTDQRVADGQRREHQDGSHGVSQPPRGRP